MRTHSLITIGLLVAMLAGAAQAQESTTAAAGPATISGTGGVTAGMHGTGPVVGAAVTYDLNDWFALEATGGYFDRGSGADAISANASLLVNVLPSSHAAVPYFAIGGGVYRASFDLGNRRFFGAMDRNSGPAPSSCPFGGWPASG